MAIEAAETRDAGIGGWLWSAVIWTAVTILLAVTVVVQSVQHPAGDGHAALGVWELLAGLLVLWGIGVGATVLTGTIIAERTAQRRAIDRSYRQLFEALPDGTFVIDWQASEGFGRISEVNPAACRLLGLERQDLLASPLSRVFAGCTPQLLASLAASLEREGQVVVEQRLAGRDEPRPVQVELRRFETAGRPAVLMIVKDLGDRQAAEWALRRRDSQLTKMSSATRRINEDLHERAVLRRLVGSAMEVLGVSEGMAGLFTDGRIAFAEFADVDGFHPCALSFAPGEGVPGQVWESLAVFRTNDGPRELPRDPEFEAHFRPVSVLAAPIVGRDGTPLGCVQVHDKVNGEAFYDDDGLVILGLAASAAIALENARMLQELRTMRQELLDREERLQRLAGELSRAEEQARRRIAEGLHDRIGQELAVMRMQLGRLGAAQGVRDGKAAIDQLRDLLDQAIADTRALTFEISPPMLYTLGLAPALEWLCEQLEEQHALAFVLHSEVGSRRVSDDARALLYISIRELLMNVVKHAQATQAEVRLTVVGEWLWAAVADDGVGFSVDERADSQDGFGLFSIRERLRGIGGEMVIRSTPGDGTEVVLEVPLETD